MNKKLLLIPLALLLAISLVAIGCPAEEEAPPAAPPAAPTEPTTPTEAPVKELKIGVLIALTGWFSSAGLLEKQECELVADMINDEGGITVDGQRYKIVPVLEDTKSSSEGVTAATNKLVYDEGLKFITGPNAFWSSASGPICEANQVFNTIGFCTNTPGELDATTEYRLLITNSSVGNCYGMTQFIKQKHPEIKSVVVINADDGAIPYLTPVVRRALEDNGISMVGDIIGFSNELVDFTSIAQRISQIEVDGIYFQNALGVPHVSSCAKSMREMGDERWIFYSSVSTAESLIEPAGAGAYKIVTGGILAGTPGNPPHLEEYFARGGLTDTIIFQCAGGLYTIPKLIETVQSFDPTVLKDSLENLDEVETMWGTGSLCGEETYGISNRAVAHPYSAQYLDENGEIQFGGWFEVDIP